MAKMMRVTVLVIAVAGSALSAPRIGTSPFLDGEKPSSPEEFSCYCLPSLESDKPYNCKCNSTLVQELTLGGPSSDGAAANERATVWEGTDESGTTKAAVTQSTTTEKEKEKEKEKEIIEAKVTLPPAVVDLLAEQERTTIASTAAAATESSELIKLIQELKQKLAELSERKTTKPPPPEPKIPESPPPEQKAAISPEQKIPESPPPLEPKATMSPEQKMIESPDFKIAEFEPSSKLIQQPPPPEQVPAQSPDSKSIEPLEHKTMMTTSESPESKPIEPPEHKMPELPPPSEVKEPSSATASPSLSGSAKTATGEAWGGTWSNIVCTNLDAARKINFEILTDENGGYLKFWGHWAKNTCSSGVAIESFRISIGDYADVTNRCQTKGYRMAQPSNPSHGGWHPFLLEERFFTAYFRESESNGGEQVISTYVEGC